MNTPPMNTPRGYESWGPALRGAYRKGWEAARAGLPAGACPYKDKRQHNGKLTWSRAFIAAWHDGWGDSSAQGGTPATTRTQT